MAETVAIDPKQWVARRWERRDADEWRYYQVFLRQDLWGEWRSTRVWGGRHLRAGRVVESGVANRQSGLALVQDIAKQRQAHRYQLADWEGTLDAC